MATMGPMLVGLQLGSAVGHLAQRAFGPYELPVPRPSTLSLLVVPANVNRFAEDWSLPRAEVRLWVCLRDLTVNAVMGRPHVAARLRDLLAEVVGSMTADLDPARRRRSEELTALTAVLLGYVEHVLDRAGDRLLGGRTALAEAWRRAQMDREEADRSAECFLGLDLGPAQVERGTRFVRGVVERAGEEGLARLWSTASALPTPAEVDAPGLWLARISLD